MERKVNSLSKEIYDKQETEALFATKPESKVIRKYVSKIIAEMKKPDTRQNDRTIS
jgi:hypothetical protein